MVFSGMLRRVAVIRTDVSEELSASFTRVTRIGELVTASVVAISPILVSLMKGRVPPKRRFLQEPHGVTSQKTPFFIVTAVKTSNLTYLQQMYVCIRDQGQFSGAEPEGAKGHFPLSSRSLRFSPLLYVGCGVGVYALCQEYQFLAILLISFVVSLINDNVMFFSIETS
jgi:hypothetical protein